MTEAKTKRRWLAASVLLASVLVALGLMQWADDTARAHDDAPVQTYLYDWHDLAASRDAFVRGEDWITDDAQWIIRRAETALDEGPFTVTNKDHHPVDGATVHDFFSHLVHYWPNPDTDDGLPWVQRDGHVNPDSFHDFDEMRVTTRVGFLGLAYLLTEDERFAEHAASLTRTFFLDPETRMNPNCEYANTVPGKPERGTRFMVAGFHLRFRELFDALAIIEASPHWTDDDKRAMQQWCREFVHWMETSDTALSERRKDNNHATAYYMQAALLSLYADDRRRARRYVQEYADDVMPRQLKAGGMQPAEFDRNNNLEYLVYNLSIIMDLAALGDRVGVDLWHVVTDEGGSLRGSLEMLVPAMTGALEWKHWPDEPFDYQPWTYYDLLRRAAAAYDDRRYLILSENLVGQWRETHQATVTHPPHAARAAR